MIEQAEARCLALAPGSNGRGEVVGTPGSPSRLVPETVRLTSPLFLDSVVWRYAIEAARAPARPQDDYAGGRGSGSMERTRASSRCDGMPSLLRAIGCRRLTWPREP